MRVSVVPYQAQGSLPGGGGAPYRRVHTPSRAVRTAYRGTTGPGDLRRHGPAAPRHRIWMDVAQKSPAAPPYRPVRCGGSASNPRSARPTPHSSHGPLARARARSLSLSLSIYIHIYIHTCACISRGASRGRPRQLETREGAGPSVSVLLGRPRPPSSAPPLQQARPPRTSPQGVARAAVRLAALVRVRVRVRVRARD